MREDCFEPDEFVFVPTGEAFKSEVELLALDILADYRNQEISEDEKNEIENRLLCKLDHCKPSLVLEVLDEILSKRNWRKLSRRKPVRSKSITADDVINIVAQDFGYEGEDLRRSSGIKGVDTWDVKKVRSAAIYFLKKDFNISFVKLSSIFDLRRNSIGLCYRRVEKQLKEDSEFAAKMNAIRSRCFGKPIS